MSNTPYDTPGSWITPGFSPPDDEETRQTDLARAMHRWNRSRERPLATVDLARFGMAVLDFVGDHKPPYDYKHGWIPVSAAAVTEQAGKLKTSAGGKTIDTSVGGKLRGSKTNVKSVHGPAKLGKRETNAIAYYEGDWETVNDVLRGGSAGGMNDETEAEIENTIAGLDSAFNKVPALPEPIVTWRGVPAEVVGSLNEGDSWRDDGFVSTSKGEEAARDYGDWILEIHTPAGNKALDLVHLGRGDWQDEVLLPAGTEFRVRSVGNNRVVLDTKPTGRHSGSAKEAEISGTPPAAEAKPKAKKVKPKVSESAVAAEVEDLRSSSPGQWVLTAKSGTPVEKEAARRLLREFLAKEEDPATERLRAAMEKLGVELSRSAPEDDKMAGVTDPGVVDLAGGGAKWSHGWVPLNDEAKRQAVARGKAGDPRFRKYAKGAPGKKAPGGAEDEPVGGGTHVVKKGDTLWALAARELGSGSRWKEIAKANGVKNPRLLQIGTKLRIPGKAGKAGKAGAGIASGERHPKGSSRTRKKRKKAPQNIPGTSIPRGGISQYVRSKNLSGSSVSPEGFEYVDLTPTSALTAEVRRKAAAKGQAMPGGRFPIKDARDVEKAIRALGRAKGSHAAVKAHIKRRAAALGVSHLIPDSWSSAEASSPFDDAAIDLAGRWRHGWIPLDAVAALSKAKGDRAAASKLLGSGRSLTPSQGRGKLGGMTDFNAPRELQGSPHFEPTSDERAYKRLGRKYTKGDQVMLPSGERVTYEGRGNQPGSAKISSKLAKDPEQEKRFGGRYRTKTVPETHIAHLDPTRSREHRAEMEASRPKPKSTHEELPSGQRMYQPANVGQGLPEGASVRPSAGGVFKATNASGRSSFFKDKTDAEEYARGGSPVPKAAAGERLAKATTTGAKPKLSKRSDGGFDVETPSGQRAGSIRKNTGGLQGEGQRSGGAVYSTKDARPWKATAADSKSLGSFRTRQEALDAVLAGHGSKPAGKTPDYSKVSTAALRELLKSPKVDPARKAAIQRILDERAR